MHPEVSIITVCRNSEVTIKDTISSVSLNASASVKQEFLVIDGASNDGTLSILENAARRGIVTRWVSEPDSGIYNAMNKGLSLASGKYCVFLNSDDCFTAEAVQSSLRQIAETGVDYLYANAEIVEDGVRQPLRVDEGDEGSIFLRHPYNHQTLFCRTELLKAVGGFDEHFLVSADHDLMWKLYRSNAKGWHFPQTTVKFRDGGTQAKMFYEHEILEIRRRHEDLYRAKVKEDAGFAARCFEDWDWRISLIPSVDDDEILERFLSGLAWFRSVFASAERLPWRYRLRTLLLGRLLAYGAYRGHRALRAIVVRALAIRSKVRNATPLAAHTPSV